MSSSRPRKKLREEPIEATYYYESGDPSTAAAPADVDDDDDDDDDDMMLPLHESEPAHAQIGAILQGSSDEEIMLILNQLPIADDGALKLTVGMQKLSSSASAFDLLRPFADACENDGVKLLFNKIGALTQPELDADLQRIFAGTDDVTSMLKLSPELRRRRFFLSLAEGYMDD